MTDNFSWWRDGIIYQIYPRSFADSNSDGIGDLPGITSRLDYLADLGIDAIWLSPFYPSPDADFGYDISNFIDVDPRFGTLADFDELVTQAHARQIRVVLDMVLNHTSDQHPWFIESRSSLDNPKREWYIWRDPAAGSKPPTNWQAAFGGKGWELDPRTGQYYFHSFLKEQPDVNWRNPEVRAAMLEIFIFWLERGVDGFRLDVFNSCFKDDQFRDNPPKFGLRGFDRQAHIYDMDRPELLPLLQEVRALLDSYPEKYAVGETYLATPDKITRYAGDERLHAAFSFDFTSQNLVYPWNSRYIMERVSQREKIFNNAGIWPTTVMSNHDLPRAASRYCRGEKDHQAMIAMALLLTLRGTPFLFQGEEIGMRDIQLKRGEILDPPGKKYWPVYLGRDGCRSPMQWSDATYAGFSTEKPWLPVHPNYVHRNVTTQQNDQNSLFIFTKRLIALRRECLALCRGTIRFISSAKNMLVFERNLDKQRVLIFINFTGHTRLVSSSSDTNQASFLLSNSGRRELTVSENHFTLNPYEVMLLEVKCPAL